MADALLEVQGAVHAMLRADTALATLVAARIYVTVPESPAFPYVSFGPADAASEDAECIDGLEITFQIDVWSRSGGGTDAKQIGGVVRKALHGADVVLADNAAVLCEHRTSRAIRDPDGLTAHVALTFTAFVEVA